MSRTPAVVAIVFACCSMMLSGQEAQPARVDTVLVLKSGQEVRGQFVGFRNGLFTIRLPDGRITIHGIGDVDRMQPATDSAPGTPAPARPAAAAAPMPQPPPAAMPAQAAPAATAVPAPAATAAPAVAPPPATELAARGCGPDGVKFPTVTDKSQHPTPAAPADKGLVYIVRPKPSGSRIQTRLAVDGTWVGANYGNNYFFLTLDPGEHFFCSQAEDRSVLALTVQAGKTYYLQQSVTTGMMKSRSSLDIVADLDGQEGLTKANLSTKREPKPQQ